MKIFTKILLIFCFFTFIASNSLAKGKTLWAWGNNYNGQLGIGEVIEKKLIPTQIGTDNDWKLIKAGIRHCLAIKDDGTLWAWGDNQYGELGNGTNKNSSYPIQIGNDTNWKEIAVGNVHSLAIKKDGTLWSWGGESNNKNIPAQIGNDTNWKIITAGWHNLAIKEDGTLWAWGRNSEGQLGIGNEESVYIPTQVGTDNDWLVVVAGGYTIFGGHSFGLKKNGSIWAWGRNNKEKLGLSGNDEYLIPTEIKFSQDWKSISTCENHTLIIDSEGLVFGTGINDKGQLGDTDLIPNSLFRQIIVESKANIVSAGNSHSLILKEDGSLWAWGDNEFGQLGTGDTLNINYPKQIGDENNWVFITSGAYCSFALKEDVIDNIENENIENKYNINLYPNPTNDELNIELKSEFINSKISIINEVGTEVYTTIIQSENFIINTIDFPNGKYFIILNNGKENIRESFVIER